MNRYWWYLVLLLSAAHSGLSQTCTCSFTESDHLFSDRFNHYCYTFDSQNVDGDAVENTCQAVSTDLHALTIENEAENMAIFENMRYQGSLDGVNYMYNLGLKKSSGDWQTKTGESWSTSTHYFNWASNPTEPDNSGSCMRTATYSNGNGHTFRDVSCSSKFTVVCKGLCLNTDFRIPLLTALADQQKCFQALVSVGTKKWSEARDACVAAGGVLAPVRNTDDFARYNEYGAQMDSDMWTGINDFDENDSWENVDGTSPAIDKSDIKDNDEGKCGSLTKNRGESQVAGKDCDDEKIPFCMFDCACASSPCQNGGTCSQDATLTGWVCDCALGWMGTDCSSAQDAAASTWTYDATSRKCHVLGPQMVRWADGLRFCKKQPISTFLGYAYNTADLTGIKTFLTGIGSTPTSVWMSMQDQTTEGSYWYFWALGVGGNNQFTADLWNVQDNAGADPGEDCTEFDYASGKINDVVCFPGTKRYPLCMRDEAATACGSTPCENQGTCHWDACLQEYTCSCLPLYTGTHCETYDGLECLSNPCTFCAPCIEGVAEWSCDCTGTGYSGNTCQTKDDICASSPCQNNGVCVAYLNWYECTCDSSHSGTLCENVKDECSPNPCNGGACDADVGSYTCDCSGTNRNGDNCEYVDQCATSNPCVHGTCDLAVDNQHYVCTCYWGWHGRNCDTDLATVPSTGQCAEVRGWEICGDPDAQLTKTKCYNTVRALADSDWNPGEFALFAGNKCCYRPSSKSQTLVKSDKNANKCEVDCAGDDTTYCGGDSEYEVFDITMTAASTKCTGFLGVDVNCLNGGICVEVDGSPGYECLCKDPYGGTLCATDHDDCTPDPCKNGAACSDSVGSYSCDCAAIGPEYSGTNCEVFDACASNPCINDGTCQKTGSTFACSCPPNFAGTLCDKYIQRHNEGANDCMCNNCTNGATCVDGDDDYTCECVLGFTGRFCETEIDECASAPCREDSTCTDFIAYFECECQGGFTGEMCETNIDDCLSKPCQHGAGCEDGVILYWCDCVTGYTGYNCETDIDECESSPCHPDAGATCQDLIGRWFCYCEPGMTGWLCDNDVNECESFPCQNGATCNNLRNHYTCTCVPGYSGEQCQIDINECSSSPCVNGATCNDLINHYTCDCDIGWTSTNCEIEIDECQSITCFNGGSCNDYIGWYNCSCIVGFTDYHCTTDIDECASTPCEYFDVCYEGVDVWWCDCTIGYTSTKCDIDIDECISDPCVNGTCNDNIAYYDCSCIPGFTGYDCETEIDECWSNPCQYFGTCNDYIAYYTCDCIAGITGLDCEINIDECLSTPCNEMDSNATCTDLINGYNCTCLPEWTETHCDLETNIWEILQLFKSGALSDLSALRDVVAQSSLIVDSVPFIVGTLPEADRWPLSWTTNDTIKWCSYEGKSCVIEEDIASRVDPVMGTCFTFNDQSLAHYKINRAGLGQGLLMYLLAGQEDYTPWVDVSGHRVYIHNQSDSVYAESVSYSVTPGYFTSIGLRWKEYKRLGTPYGVCYNDVSEAKNFYYSGSYSADGCLRSCYQNEVAAVCGCMDPRYPSPEGAVVCGLNDRRCVNEFVDEKGDPSQWTDCTCPLPCYNGEYDVAVSRTRFRVSPVECAALNDSSACIQNVTNNLMKMELFFEDLSYIVLQETPRDSIEGLMSNVGGQMGILCGMSVFSICEILFTFAQVFIVMLTGRAI